MLEFCVSAPLLFLHEVALQHVHHQCIILQEVATPALHVFLHSHVLQGLKAAHKHARVVVRTATLCAFGLLAQDGLLAQGVACTHHDAELAPRSIREEKSAVHDKVHDILDLLTLLVQVLARLVLLQGSGLQDVFERVRGNFAEQRVVQSDLVQSQESH